MALYKAAKDLGFIVRRTRRGASNTDKGGYLLREESKMKRFKMTTNSAQGSQYFSIAYRNIIDQYQLRQSMSRKGNCWDNGCVERFFHFLKVEAIHDEPIIDRKAMHQRVFECIEVDCNLTRRHSALGYISPGKFEQLIAQNLVSIFGGRDQFAALSKKLIQMALLRCLLAWWFGLSWEFSYMLYAIFY